MKPNFKYVIISVLLCLLVEVRAPPSLDEGKNIDTRSNPGAVGDPKQAGENDRQSATDNKKVYTPNKSDTDKNKETLEDKKENGAATSSTTLPTSPTSTAERNCTNSTDKDCEEGVKPSLKEMLTSMVTENKDMLKRTLWVLIGVTVIVVVYYVMRAVR